MEATPPLPQVADPVDPPAPPVDPPVPPVPPVDPVVPAVVPAVVPVVPAVVSPLDFLRVAPNYNQQNADECLPVFSSDGAILPGIDQIVDDLSEVTTSPPLESQAAGLARFQQYLSPLFLTARAYYMWYAVPRDNVGPMHIPANDLDGEKGAIASLLVGDTAHKWAMVKDAHVCYQLFLLWVRLVNRILVGLPVAVGNRTVRAKKLPITEILDAMYNSVIAPDDERVVVRWRLLLQLKYGEDLRPFFQHVAEQIPDDPGAAIAALAVFPLEHLAVRKANVSCLKNIPLHKRRYGLWLATKIDNIDILVALTRYVGQFVFRDAVLDRLCGYPIAGSAPPPPFPNATSSSGTGSTRCSSTPVIRRSNNGSSARNPLTSPPIATSALPSSLRSSGAQNQAT